LSFGEEVTGRRDTGRARVAGIALIALTIACWPGPPRVSMLTYSSAATLYLAYLGFAGGLTGILLWPAVVLHAILTALLIWASTNDMETKTYRHRAHMPDLIRHGSDLPPSVFWSPLLDSWHDAPPRRRARLGRMVSDAAASDIRWSDSEGCPTVALVHFQHLRN